VLATLIYRSRLNCTLDPSQLTSLVERANLRNSQLQVTGILLFDGDHFLQILEGPLAAVNVVYERINRDNRHSNVVELLRDYAPRRRFVDRGMMLFDLCAMTAPAVLRAILRFGTLKYQLASNDRVYKFIRNFIASPKSNGGVRNTGPEQWSFTIKTSPFNNVSAPITEEQPCQFAFQPIIEPLRGNISSLEALIRGPNGGSPQEYFATIAPNKLHEADLASKGWALAMARRLGIGNHNGGHSAQPHHPQSSQSWANHRGSDGR